MSMEEERARRRAQEQVAAGAVPSEAPQLSSIPEAGPSTSVPQTVVDVAPGAVTSESSAFDDDEEAALQEALRLSQQADDVEMSDATKPGTHASTTHGQDEEMDEDEEEAIARAIEMSMQPGQEQKKWNYSVQIFSFSSHSSLHYSLYFQSNCYYHTQQDYMYEFDKSKIKQKENTWKSRAMPIR